MYNLKYNLVANPINRYSLGDRSGLKRDADGADDLHPEGLARADRRATGCLRRTDRSSSSFAPTPGDDIVTRPGSRRRSPPSADNLSRFRQPKSPSSQAHGFGKDIEAPVQLGREGQWTTRCAIRRILDISLRTANVGFGTSMRLSAIPPPAKPGHSGLTAQGTTSALSDPLVRPSSNDQYGRERNVGFQTIEI